MKNLDKVFLRHWLPYHPYTDMHITDATYLQVCNAVYQTWQKDYSYQLVADFLSKDDIKEMAAFLTCYLEDLASETGLFRTFSSLHKELYGEPIPFANNGVLYDEPDLYKEDYFEGEPNSADLIFLIWYFINCKTPNSYIDANNYFIVSLALIAYEEFYSYWETVPENTKLQEHFRFKENPNDYYEARNYASKFFQSNYLLVPDISNRILEKVEEISVEQDGIGEMLNEVLDNFIHTEKSRLLALSFTDWTAAYLGEKHPAYISYKSISPRISGFFQIEDIGVNTVSMLHKASEHVFEVLTSSLDLELQEIEKHTTHYLSIVRWKEQWWFSGTSFKTEDEPKIAPEEYRHINTLHLINRVIGNPEKDKEELQLYQKAFHQLNGGKNFAFMEIRVVGEFYSRFAQKVNQLKGYPDDEVTGEIPSKSGEDMAVIFFNEKAGLEVAYVAEGIPDKNNPGFDPDAIEEMWNILLMADTISPEFAKTCIEEYGESSGFFKEEPKSYYQNDLDFLLRYWKYNHYQSDPRISTV